jgi:cell division protein FtsN
VTLAAAVIVLGGLLFFSGVLVGLGLWKPTMDEIALAKEYRQREQAARQAPVKPPVAPVAAVAAPAPAPATPPSQPAAPAEHESAAPATAPAPTPAPASPPQISPAAQAADAAADSSQFVLQVGSFRDAKNAQQLQSELKAKGYPATVFDAMDSDQRMWHVVRIGHYQDVASAAVEAARIGDQERLQALIRRGGRL